MPRLGAAVAGSRHRADASRPITSRRPYWRPWPGRQTILDTSGAPTETPASRRTSSGCRTEAPDATEESPTSGRRRVVPRARRRRRAVRPDQHRDDGVAFAEEVGLEPVAWSGRDPRPCLRCATRSRSPRRLATSAAPALDEHGARSGLAAGRGADGTGRTGERASRLPDRRWATSTPTIIQLLGQDLAGDLMGKVGFGELAFWLVARRRPTPGERGSSRRCSSRSPTTASRPRRSPPGSPIFCARLGAGRAGGRAARRRVALPRGHRGLRPVPARRARPHATGALPTDDAGWDALALDGRTARPARPGGFVPGLGHHVHKDATPARRGCSRSPTRRACSGRTCRCSPRSAGCTRRCSAGRCRSTAPASAARRWPTSACPWTCCAASRCWPAPPG